MRILGFLNLLDDGGNLSITNIGVYALICKFLISAHADWPSSVALIGTLLNYAHKRQVNNDSRSNSPEPGP